MPVFAGYFAMTVKEYFQTYLDECCRGNSSMGNGDNLIRTVLVVEDIDWIRAGMVREIKRRRYRVLEAVDAEEAISIAERVPLDAVLTEEQLPTLASLTRRFSEHLQLRHVLIVIVNPDEEEGTRYGEIIVLSDYDQLERALINSAKPSE